jgi:hypothetical protein
VLRLGFLLALLAGGVAGIGATQRSLAALQEERELTVRIRDDGSGFDVAAASAAPGRLGLRTMRPGAGRRRRAGHLVVSGRRDGSRRGDAVTPWRVLLAEAQAVTRAALRMALPAREFVTVAESATRPRRRGPLVSESRISPSLPPICPVAGSRPCGGSRRRPRGCAQ